jgi:hypothetical protein
MEEEMKEDEDTKLRILLKAVMKLSDIEIQTVQINIRQVHLVAQK